MWKKTENVCKYNISRETTTQMKGIAIFCVILGHVLNYCIGSSISNISALLGTGGVWVFLILSGYGVYCSYEKKGLDIKTYWNSKINNVFIPYIIVTLLYYLYLRVTGRQVGLQVLLKNFLCLDFERNIDATMWYMSFLLIWYVLFFLIYYFDFSKLLKMGILFICAYCFQKGYYGAYFADCNWQFIINAYAFPTGVLVGYIIHYMNKYGEHKKSFIKKKGYVFTIACIIIYVCGCLNVIELSYGKYGILLFIIVHNLLKYFTIINGFLTKIWYSIGKYSYFLYLIEGKCITILAGFEFMHNMVIFTISLIGMLIILVYIYKNIIIIKEKIGKGNTYAV